MFGLFLGTACLLGLIWVIRGGRDGRHGPCSYDRGRDAHWHERGRRPFGRNALLRWIFERLDTTPGQERVIRSAVDDFADRAQQAKRQVASTRSDVARAFRADSFDAEAMGEAFSKHDDALTDLRKAAVEALARCHEVLDERQRERLAELVEAGIGRRWYGPYRSAF